MAEKKERKPFISDLILLGIVAAVLLVLYLIYSLVNWVLIKPIDADDVQKITFGSSHELNEAQIEEFIEIYHSSKYYGKERNFDTTPDYQFNIYLDDSTWIDVSEYGHLFIVEYHYSNGESELFHVKNNKLDGFVEDWRASYTKTNAPAN